uniref:Protein SRG1 n=1 Tax=Aegilops tauschii TaxID=37682 RepID=M8C6H5_AEGTA
MLPGLLRIAVADGTWWGGWRTGVERRRRGSGVEPCWSAGGAGDVEFLQGGGRDGGAAAKAREKKEGEKMGRMESRGSGRVLGGPGVSDPDILCEYTVRCRAVANIILQNLAKLLNLQEEYLTTMLGEKSLTHAIINYYPRCPMPDHVLGLKPHTDASMITVNFIDADVSGLQLQKNCIWYNVPIVPNALVVNIGDVMEIVSNGFFKSLVHRVVTNAEKERLSLVMFYALDPEAEIEPVQELVDDQRPRRYRKMKSKDYLAKFFDTYATGKLAIDSMRI